jgi:hypothetical protein
VSTKINPALAAATRKDCIVAVGDIYLVLPKRRRPLRVAAYWPGKAPRIFHVHRFPVHELG